MLLLVGDSLRKEFEMSFVGDWNKMLSEITKWAPPDVVNISGPDVPLEPGSPEASCSKCVYFHEGMSLCMLFRKTVSPTMVCRYFTGDPDGDYRGSGSDDFDTEPTGPENPVGVYETADQGPEVGRDRIRLVR